MNLSSTLDRVAEEVVRISADTALLAVGVALLATVLRSWLPARVRYALWMLIPIRLLVFTSVESSWSFFNRTPPLQLSPGPGEIIELRPDHYSRSIEDMRGKPLPDSASTLALRRFYVLWIGGIALFGVGLCANYLRLRSRVSRATRVVDPGILAILAEARHLVGDSSGWILLEVEGIPTPSLFGSRKILLPVNAVHRVKNQELRCALLHELVHKKRKDHWVNGLLLLLQLVHWFNPLVWFACYRVRAEMEHACDEWVIALLGRGSRQLYFESLLTFLSSDRGSEGLLAFAWSQSAGELRRRVENLARPRPGVCRLALCYTVVSALALLVLSDRKKTPPFFSVDGRVIDDSTGKPVPNFQIETLHWIALAPGQEMETVYAQPNAPTKDGNFKVRFHPDHPVTKSMLRVSAPGYENLTSPAFSLQSVAPHLMVRMARSN